MKLASCLAAALLCAVMPATARAAAPLDWPTGTIHWIVGFVPGGTADTLTRIAAQELARQTGKSVVVENRSGASGAIALQYVARSRAADGLLITVPGPLIYPSPQPRIGHELAPVALMAEGPMVIVGPAGAAQDSLQDVIEAARRQPDAWSYGSSGTGTSQHLAGELLNQQAGTRMTHIPYKGGGQAVSDVSGGQIPLAILGPTPVMSQIRSGTLQAYAVTTAYRISSLPEVPTMREAGFRDYEASQWFAVAAVQSMPARQLDALNGLLREAFKSAAFQQALATAGMVAGDGSRAELLAFLRADQQKWDALVRSGTLQLAP